MNYELPALYQIIPVAEAVAHYGNKCNGLCRDGSPPQSKMSSCGAYEVDE